MARTTRSFVCCLLGLCGVAADASVAGADVFEAYTLTGSFELPAGAGEFDVLPDGRLITVAEETVYLESAVGSRAFAAHATLPDVDFPSFGPAFVRASPDGTKLAVGNNGGASFTNYRVGVFDLDTWAGDWFSASHFDGQWYDDSSLGLTAGEFGQPSVVTVLDTSSADPANPTNTTVVGNIGGASAGVAFDPLGNLYTGNGFAGAGPSGTGAVKYFDHSSWTAALTGGSPVDFEADGTLI
ncbi:MAG: hypothetical protein ACYSVY_13800, partial [Planctomycetota bacterium]